MRAAKIPSNGRRASRAGDENSAHLHPRFLSCSEGNKPSSRKVKLYGDWVAIGRCGALPICSCGKINKLNKAQTLCTDVKIFTLGTYHYRPVKAPGPTIFAHLHARTLRAPRMTFALSSLSAPQRRAHLMRRATQTRIMPAHNFGNSAVWHTAVCGSKCVGGT